MSKPVVIYMENGNPLSLAPTGMLRNNISLGLISYSVLRGIAADVQGVNGCLFVDVTVPM